MWDKKQLLAIRLGKRYSKEQEGNCEKQEKKVFLRKFDEMGLSRRELRGARIFILNLNFSRPRTLPYVSHQFLKFCIFQRKFLILFP